MLIIVLAYMSRERLWQVLRVAAQIVLAIVLYVKTIHRTTIEQYQAPVARKVNSAIHRINPIERIKLMQLSNKFYPLDKTYPVDQYCYSPFVQPGPGHLCSYTKPDRDWEWSRSRYISRVLWIWMTIRSRNAVITISMRTRQSGQSSKSEQSKCSFPLED